MTPDELLALDPAFHLDARGEPISWGIGADLLRHLAGRLREGDRTLETGAGVSTVCFALLGCRHTAITPFRREVDLIRRFCDEHRIPLDRVELIVERSERALPRMAADPLDLVLIDGRHAFPSPFIDWYYGAEALRPGGWIVVDDTHLLTCRILRDFMAEDPHWGAVAEIGKSAIFEKLDNGVHDAEWDGQPYVFARR